MKCRVFLLSALVALVAAVGPLHAQPSIIAHRGLFKSCPENTIAAFEACLKLGIGIEFDVRTTRDGTLVILHDRTLNRTTNGGERELREMDLAELKRLDAGSWFDAKFSEERVPTLKEFIALLQKYPESSVPLAVNVKDVDEAGEVTLVRELKKAGLLERAFFFDQDEASSRRLKALDSAVRIGQNVGKSQIDHELDKGLVDVFLIGFVPSEGIREKLRGAGKGIVVNKGGKRENDDRPEAWKDFLSSDVDGMLVDYAQEFHEYLKTLK